MFTFTSIYSHHTGDKTSNPSAPELGRFCDLNSMSSQARHTSSGQYLTAVFTTSAANVEDDEGFFLRYYSQYNNVSLQFST